MKKRIYFLILSLLLMVGIVVVISFAWFTNTEFVEPDISGYSISAYFGGGDGSDEEPFQIKNERHLYNLAWLQYLGYFNKPGSGNEPDENNTETLTQYSFVVMDDLDMEGWVLPPIGTSFNPFIGNLDGGNYTISNLTTTNRYQDFGERHPNTVTSDKYVDVEIIGFVGVIGKPNSQTLEVTEETLNYYDYDVTNVPTLTNLTLDDNIVKSVTTNVLIGSVAGYVNGYIENVGIKDSTLKVNSTAVVESIQDKITNLSDYSVVGYAEDAYTTAKTNNNTTIYNPTTTYDHFTYYGMGNSDNWGGSLDMSSLYTRINSKVTTKVTSYKSGEIHYYNSNNEEYGTPITQYSSNPTTLDDEVAIPYYYNEYGASGAYLTADTAPTTTIVTGYDYLGGLYKDVVSVKVTGTTNGYKLLNPNGNYLNMTSERVDSTINFSTSITSDNDASTATVWVVDYDTDSEGYIIYTYNGDDGKTCYLGTTNYSTLSLSNSNKFIWKYSSSTGYYTTYNSVDYYIRYINNNWVVSNKRAYYITDGTNYLTRNGETIVNRTNPSEATKWIFENESTKTGVIYDESNTNYKLYISGTSLTAPYNGNSTSWSNNGSIIYNGSNYIIFDGSKWTLYQQNQFYIKSGSYYLSLNSDGSISNSVTNESNATLWTFSDSSSYPKGYISATTNNTTYYLRNYNNTLTTTTSTTYRTNWSNTGSGIYNNNYYIQYKNNAWTLSQRTNLGYYISYNGNYLSYDEDSGELYNVTSASDATYWQVYNNNVYALDSDGTRQYLVSLNKSGSNLGISATETRRFQKNGSQLIYRRGTNYSYYYIYYSNGWKTSTTAYNLNWEDAYDDFTLNVYSDEISYTSTTQLYSQNLSLNTGTVTTYTRSVNKVPSLANYIPLNTDENYNVLETNTGYIMSGGHSGTSGGLDAVDIRVAGEAKAYSFASNGRLSKSINTNGQIIVTNGKDQIYTCDATTEHVIDPTKYKKYASSKEGLQAMLTKANSSNNKRVGGIHFIDSSISINNLVTASHVMINGQTYDDYQMPENSIDFNLKTKGYINFFAALFYNNNTSFFSLHEIKRDNNQKIIEINHIKAIYENKNDKSLEYIYLYETPNSAGYIYSNNSNYIDTSIWVEIFNTEWIESPKLSKTGNTINWDDTSRNLMHKLYYYEVPVNKGEYALGSVSGSDGGYLLYLDIGANAAVVDRTAVSQKTETIKSDYKYVNGIQILDSSSTATTMNAANSAVAIIPTSSSNIGDIEISRTGNNITFSEALDSTYLGKGITASNLTLTALSPPTTVTENVLKYYDYNKAIDTLYVTTITNNGTSNTGYTVYKVLTDSTELIANQDTADILSQEYGLLAINATTGAGEPIALTNVTVVTSKTERELDYDFLVDTADKNNIETTVEMNFEAIPTTGTVEVTNADTASAPAKYTFTNGSTVLSDDYVVDKAYRFIRDTITVTLDATTQVRIYVNVAQNYTFVINTITATTSSEDIYTVAP